MKLNDTLRNYFKKKLNSDVEYAEAISGGSINDAAKVRLKNGDTWFVKWNTGVRANMFETEYKGLELLRKADSGLVFPDLVSHEFIPDKNISFLVLEYLEPEKPSDSFFEAFGRELAGLHKNKNARYGLDHDNYIGRLPQDNTPSDDWIEFMVEQRLRPQFEMAVDAGQLPSTLIQNAERLFEQLEDILPEEKPGLLHGDLWNGNFLSVSGNRAALVDPAVYYGNREIELAFTQLFGGFDQPFYDAYHEAFPLQPGFDDRVDVYNLYPLLVHVNMFGRAYASQVQAIMQSF